MVAADTWFNIKMSSYQYRKSHCGDKTVVRSSYLHNGISYTGKISFYWIGPPGVCLAPDHPHQPWWSCTVMMPQHTAHTPPYTADIAVLSVLPVLVRGAHVLVETTWYAKSECLLVHLTNNNPSIVFVHLAAISPHFRHYIWYHLPHLLFSIRKEIHPDDTATTWPVNFLNVSRCIVPTRRRDVTSLFKSIGGQR